MDAAGAIELLMPALQPVELWKESGRYEAYGDLLMKLTISGGHQMALGPTHEEVITDMVRDLIRSYKQLPITLYQIQTKFRDEPRPRFGIVRTREFLMKDAYSIDADLGQLNTSYDAMYEAYCRIFDRCGVPYVIVEAESGPIGGDSSHEFMVPCSTGEDTVIQCAACGYAANQERAEIGGHDQPTRDARRRPRRPTRPSPTPNKRTIREVCEFLKVDESTSAKLLVYLADGKPVAASLRGDHELNEAKFRRAVGAATLVPADAATIEKATGAPMGFLGPGRDQDPAGDRPRDRRDADGRRRRQRGRRPLEGRRPGPRLPARAGPRHPQRRRRRPLPALRDSRSRSQSGLEIGHVFKLGTKYSKAMGATYLDEKGQRESTSSWAATGSASTGSSPRPSRPATTPTASSGRWRSRLITSWSSRSRSRTPAVMEQAAALETALTAAGLDVLVDDRDQRPGVKFKDADLIGIPLRVVVGERGLKDGTIEIKWRHQRRRSRSRRRRRPRRSSPSSTRPGERHDASCAERRTGPGGGEGVMSRMPPLPRLPVRPARAR